MSYGGGAWGATPWGDGLGGTGAALELVSVIATRENVFRATFTLPVYFTGLLDPKDSGYVARYKVDVVDSTGIDGSATWPVTPVRVDAVADDPYSVDIVLDRPMTPWPSRYLITLNGIWDSTQTLMLPLGTQTVATGVHQNIEPASSLEAPQARDFANPQTRSAALDLADPDDPRNLAALPIDDTGDIAFDEGTISLKKRLLRRLFTKRGGFAHLPDYGVDVMSYGKRLGTGSIRAQLAADAEQQLGSEPEIAKVVVRVQLTDSPGIYRLDVLARTRQGTTLKMGSLVA